MTDSALMPDTTTLPDLGVTLTPPLGWAVGTVRTPLGEPVVLVPEPWGPGLGFRPSLSVVSVPSAGAPVSPHRAATEAMAVALAEQDAHLLSDDRWPGGRRLRWLAWVAGEELVLQQWVVAMTDRVLTFTATVDVERWTVVGPLLEDVVAGARIEGEQAPEQPYNRRWQRARSTGADPEPARDLDLLDLGENLEDLSRVRAEQRFRPPGVTVDRESLLAWVRDGTSAPELADVGLVDHDGAPTETGARLRTVVAGADRVVRVEASVGLLPLTLSLHRRGGDTIVLATDGISQWRAADPHRRALGEVPSRIHVMDLSTVGTVGVLCSWLGVAPAWSLALDPPEVSRDRLLSRLQDRTTPPPHTQERWRQIWRRLAALWTLRVEDADGPLAGLVAVDAGDRGAYLLTEPAEVEWEGAGEVAAGTTGAAPAGAERVGLTPLPSAALFDELVALVIDPVRVP